VVIRQYLLERTNAIATHLAWLVEIPRRRPLPECRCVSRAWVRREVFHLAAWLGRVSLKRRETGSSRGGGPWQPPSEIGSGKGWRRSVSAWYSRPIRLKKQLLPNTAKRVWNAGP
jgi:hypothetical protein